MGSPSQNAVWVFLLLVIVLAVAVGGWRVMHQSHARPKPDTTHASAPASGNQSAGTNAAAQWSNGSSAASPGAGVRPGEALSADEARLAELRRHMVERHLAARDITNRRVLEVMGRIKRHLFVPDDLRFNAYDDRPLPIGHGQTISQPYIVALMTQLADPQPDDRALDIGTGSGYQAAILAELCKEVYSIEIIEPLADAARKRLERLGYKNVTVRCGDGYRGWKEKAPFDVIIVAAAPDHVPQPLVDQLAPGGRLVIPVGRGFQELLVVEKDAQGRISRRSVADVAFVPMTGEAEHR